MMDYVKFEGREYAITTQKAVTCDGSTGALGHPREYISIGADGEARCKYCDRIFVLASSELAKTLKDKGEAIADPAGHMAAG